MVVDLVYMLGGAFQPAAYGALSGVEYPRGCANAVSFDKQFQRKQDFVFLGLKIVKDRSLPGGEPLLAGSAVKPLVRAAVDANIAGIDFAIIRTFRVGTNILGPVQFRIHRHWYHPQYKHSRPHDN